LEELQDEEIQTELNIDNQSTIMSIVNGIVKIKTYRCKIDV